MTTEINVTLFVTAASNSEKGHSIHSLQQIWEKNGNGELVRKTHQKQSASRKDKPVSDAPTTTILALMATFGSMVNFLLIRLRANGA